jgi:hypothetical protein
MMVVRHARPDPTTALLKNGESMWLIGSGASVVDDWLTK